MEDFFFKVMIIIHEILSQSKEQENLEKKHEEEHFSQRSVTSSRYKRTGRIMYKAKSSQKSETNKPSMLNATKSDPHPPTINSEEEFPEKDLKKRTIKFILLLLATNNSLYSKHRKVLINNNSLQGLMNLLLKVCSKEPDNVQLFVEKKGV